MVLFVNPQVNDAVLIGNGIRVTILDCCENEITLCVTALGLLVDGIILVRPLIVTRRTADVLSIGTDVFVAFSDATDSRVTIRVEAPPAYCIRRQITIQKARCVAPASISGPVVGRRIADRIMIGANLRLRVDWLMPDRLAVLIVTTKPSYTCSKVNYPSRSIKCAIGEIVEIGKNINIQLVDVSHVKYQGFQAMIAVSAPADMAISCLDRKPKDLFVAA